MASCSDEDLVVLVLTDPLVSLHEESKQEKSISATVIHNWDLPLILCSHVVKVQASRSRLTDQSSYFRGLLDGSFSESKLSNISVQWNPETVISVLQSIYGCSVNVTSINILSLLEGAMFFGVEALLLVCETWLSEITFGRGSCPPQLPLVAIVKIWNFASENGIGFISELCTAYLARYFVWATSCSSFSDIPFDLINSCTEHPLLTVESEKQLCEALLVWLAGNVRSLECSSSKSGEDYVEILTKVRACLLPLAFVLGQRRNPYFSKIADKRVMDIFCPMNDYPSSLVNTIANNASDEFRVRLTKYSKKIDLSGFGCSTVALLFLSVFPQGLETTLQKGLIQYSNELNHCSGDNYQFSKYFFTTLSFESVHELDISKCLKLNFGATIMLFHRAFPSLRVLKLSYCSKFKIGDLYHLIENCPLISDVDLTVDVSPLIPGQVSILSENTERYQVSDGTPYRASKEGSLFSSIANRTLETPFLSHIAKLTLEGRTDLSDLDLVHVSSLSGSLSYINLKGCTSITDVGISKLICQCISVDSMFVSYTSFGRNSVLALCSDYMFSNGSDDLKHSYTMASRLQRLHVDGCIGIDQTSMKRLMGHVFMLKSLSLRETSLLHDALYDFRGFSLEYLDVSETMASTAALTYVIRRSQGLRILKASSCRNLQHSQSSHSAFTADTISEDLYCELGRKCVLEEVSFGWGFSHFSLENMKPAMRETKTIMLGLGASLDQHALSLLPKICPLLEVVILKFQVISDDVLRSILGSLRNLRVLGLCCCPGDLTSHCFQIGMPHLRALRLERVTPWLTNDGLSILTQNCPNVVELSLSGCKHLNSDSQLIISSGWPGLAYLHLEDCGKVTSDGVSFLFDCKAVEDLLLRHNGQGIKRNFIADVASKMPLLRKIALDLCDALDGGFDSPGLHDRFGFSTIKIACCKRQRCGFDLQRLGKFWSVHKESIVLEWSSKELRTTIVKERV